MCLACKYVVCTVQTQEKYNEDATQITNDNRIHQSNIEFYMLGNASQNDKRPCFKFVDMHIAAHK